MIIYNIIHYAGGDSTIHSSYFDLISAKKVLSALQIQCKGILSKDGWAIYKNTDDYPVFIYEIEESRLVPDNEIDGLVNSLS
jgi:hypothetical protein